MLRVGQRASVRYGHDEVNLLARHVMSAFSSLTTVVVGSKAGRFVARQYRRLLAHVETRLAALTAKHPQSACLRYWLGTAMVEQRRLDRGADAFQQAIALAPTVAAYHYRLARVRQRQKRWRLVVPALEEAVRLDASHPGWHHRLGVAYEAMRRLDDAARAFGTAARMRPRRADWHYHHGRVLHALDQHRQAQEAFARAIRHDHSGRGRRFGIGAFHERHGAWPAAAQAYGARALEHPNDAELLYRLGMAHDRCYRWDQAAQAYRRALQTVPSPRPLWQGRLGLSLERLGLWNDAAEAYRSAAVTTAVGSTLWWYRAGYALTHAGEHGAAVEAFLRMGIPERRPVSWRVPTEVTAARRRLEEDPGDSKLWLSAGDSYRRANDWAAAARCYASAVARESTHRPNWYFRLGEALARQRRLKEACEAFLNTRVVRTHHGASETPYRKSVSFRLCADYAEYLDCLPIEDKLVLYESFHGQSVSCNPLAIFLELLDDERFAAYVHVWAVNAGTPVPAAYGRRQNVIFIRRESDLYLRYLASAKHLVNNTSFPAYFIRRPEQVYVNTWHGTPLKSLGRDERNSFMAWGNVTRNLLHATHIISPNAHTSDVLLGRFGGQGVHQAIVAETGYPRIDRTLRCSTSEKEALRARLGIARKSRVVLYAPTFRGTAANASLGGRRVVEALEALRRLDCHVLFRGHYFAERALEGTAVDACLVPGSVDSNELLAIVDVLITDYSSIAFDFMATGRAVLYYVYDLETYAQERGLYFSMEELAGETCRTVPELLSSVERALVSSPPPCSMREANRLRFCPHEDGHSGQRVVDLVFFGRSDGCTIRQRSNKPSLLFFGGDFTPNGITTAYLNLLNHLDLETLSVVIAVNPRKIAESTECLAQFARLDPRVQWLPRVGRMLRSIEEHWIDERFSTGYMLESPAMWAVYRRAYAREARRLLGTAHFDALIHFDSYGLFWASVFAWAPMPRSGRRILYHHNNMFAEMVARFPTLEATHRLSEYYDLLLSVSPSTCAINRENLASRFGLDPRRFDWCANVQDPEGVVARSRWPLEVPEDERLLDAPGPKFIALGRLSPEKGHAKLIRAFRMVLQRSPNARLAIVGGGPLECELKALVANLDLQASVFVLGRRANPYPYLARCDCFVMSSDYEGQPVVLFEALILGLPIVCADIPPARDVLGTRHGLIVENSERGLATGMTSFIEGLVRGEAFDAADYQRRAIRMFEDKVVWPSSAPPATPLTRSVSSPLSSASAGTQEPDDKEPAR